MRERVTFVDGVFRRSLRYRVELIAIGFKFGLLRVLFICCLALILSASSAGAQLVSLLPMSGPVTTEVTVTGSAFGSSEKITVNFDSLPVATTTSGSHGTFQTSFNVPKSALPGIHPVKVTGGRSGISVVANFTVTAAWPKFHLGPTNSGFNPFENVIGVGNISALEQVWTGPTGAANVASPPTVVNGVAYVVASDGMLYALDAKGNTGCLNLPSSKSCSPLWTAQTSGPITGSPAVFDGRVYVGSQDGRLYVFSASGCGAPTCSLLWNYKTGGGIISSPVIVSGTVYVGSFDNLLYAFKANGCGSTLCFAEWTGATGGFIESSPAVANGMVYVGSSDAKLYAFKAGGCGSATCIPTWTGGTTSAVNSSPAVVGGVIYVGSNNHKLYAFNAAGCGSATCSPLWTGTTGGVVFSSPAVANGVVYVGSSDHDLYAFKASGCGSSTCAPLWTAATGAAVTSSPAVANGVVYVGSQDDSLYAFSAGGTAGCSGTPKRCSPLFSFATDAPILSSPAIADGVVYIGSNDHALHAFAPPCLPSCPVGVNTCLRLGPTFGPPTSSVAACGSGYGTSETVSLNFGSTAVGRAITSASGSFITSLKVPKAAAPGNHLLTGTGATSGRVGSATFLVRTDWVKHHFDVNNSGLNSFENTTNPTNVSGLSSKWSFPQGNGDEGAPTIVNGIAYINVTALNATTGQQMWGYDGGIGSDFLDSTPTVAGDFFFLGSFGASDAHPLYAFSASADVNCSAPPGSTTKTCTPVWVGLTGSRIASSPAVVGNTVYVVDNSDALYAFSAGGCGTFECRPLWRANTPGVKSPSFLSDGAPGIANGVAYVGADKLYAFDANGVTGCSGTPKLCTPLWTGATGGDVLTSASIGNGVVFVGAADGKLYAFKAGGCGSATCSPLWTAATSGRIANSTPAVANGVVYVGSTDKNLYAFSASGTTNCSGTPKTCTPLWKYSTVGVIGSPPVVANGVVYVASDGNNVSVDGHLYAFKADGTSLAPLAIIDSGSKDSIRAEPVIANGFVYLASTMILQAFHP